MATRGFPEALQIAKNAQNASTLEGDLAVEDLLEALPDNAQHPNISHRAGMVTNMSCTAAWYLTFFTPCVQSIWLLEKHARSDVSSHRQRPHEAGILRFTPGTHQGARDARELYHQSVYYRYRVYYVVIDSFWLKRLWLCMYPSPSLRRYSNSVWPP